MNGSNQKKNRFEANDLITNSFTITEAFVLFQLFCPELVKDREA